MPLERSNFAMLLGSSGVVNWVTNPLKNVYENANTLALGGVGTFAKEKLLELNWINMEKEKRFSVCFELYDGS